MTAYSENFYNENYQNGAKKSACEIIPLILDLIRPSSVIDVGCGIGTWLSIFKKFGINDIFGIDGEWLNQDLLKISKDRFLSFDFSKPLRLKRKFDLVISLEVAEHLSSESAQTFVDSLVNLGSVVVFSAAIPFQGGVEHLNEQWPDYWVERFQKHDFFPIDCLRKKIWQNENVEWWYAQNIMLFAHKKFIETHNILKKEIQYTYNSQLRLVHPKQYMNLVEQNMRLRAYYADFRNLSPKRVILNFPSMLMGAIKRKVFH